MAEALSAGRGQTVRPLLMQGQLNELRHSRELVAIMLPEAPELHWVFERLDREVQALEMNDPLARARLLAAHHRAMA